MYRVEPLQGTDEQTTGDEGKNIFTTKVKCGRHGISKNTYQVWCV